jgi:general secretion pathway protein A
MLLSNEELLLAADPRFESWDLKGPAGHIDCARPVWDKIVAFVMEGFHRSPSGGPEVGGVLLGRRTQGGLRIDAWREVPSEHASGPRFELSQQDQEKLRRSIADPQDNSFEVVGWFQSRYWDVRWSHTSNWDFSLSSVDTDLHERYFTKPWQVVLLIQRAKSGPTKIGLFFKKEDGSFDSIARDFAPTGEINGQAGSVATQSPALPEQNAGVIPAVIKPIVILDRGKRVEPHPLGLAENIATSKAEPVRVIDDVGIVRADAAVTNDSVSAVPFVAVQPSMNAEPVWMDPVAAVAQNPPVGAELIWPVGRDPASAPPAVALGDQAALRIPPTSVEDPGWLSEYWKWFALSRNPFDPNSNQELMYWSTQHKQILWELAGAIEYRRGIAVLTGEPGVGKTMLIAALADRLAKEEILFGMLRNSRVTVDQFYNMLAYDFGLGGTGGDKIAVLYSLTQLAETQALRGRTTALVVDEAHNLPSDVLEEIRLLDNLQVKDLKLLQIVLAGQHTLELALEGRGNFKQRITLHCTLDPLSEQDTCACITHRFAKSGLDRQEVFPLELMRQIHRQSEGIPRVMNTICDNLLRTCAIAGRKTATPELLVQITKQLHLVRSA